MKKILMLAPPVVGRAALSYAEKIIALFGANLIGYWPLDETSGTDAINYGTTGAAANGVYGGGSGAAFIPTLAQVAAPGGGMAPTFDGGDYVNIQSAALAAAFNGNEGTVLIWVKVANAELWTVDNTGDQMISFYSDGDNFLGINKYSTNGIYRRRVAATVSKANYVAETSTDWILVGLTWSDSGDAQIGYKNALASGATLNTLSTYAGALTRARIGATASTVGAQDFWQGNLAHAIILDRVATPTEIGKVANFFFDVAVDGIWTWFNDARAIRYDNQTFIGAIDSQGSPFVTTFHHDTGKMDNPTCLQYAMQVDDHDNPGLLIRASDSRLMAFYCKHGSGGAGYFMRVSTNPLDASLWAAEVDIDTALGSTNSAYANPIQLTGELNDPIYLFWRETVPGGNYGTMCGISSDDGATWTSKLLVKNAEQRPYFRAIANGTDRIDFVTTEGHPATVATSIYHYYYQGGKYYQSDGTEIGNDAVLPLDPATDLTKVYNGGTVRGWCWDIAIDGSGNPVIVYATFPTPASDHRYRYARWTGAAWEDNEICTAGGPLYAEEAYYSGGLALDPANVNIVYASRQVAGVWQIFKYVTADGGATWTSTQLTAGAASSIRPFVVRNHGAGNAVVYVNGAYTTYTDYATRLVIL